MTPEQYNGIYNILSQMNDSLKQIVEITAQTQRSIGRALATSGRPSGDAAPNLSKPLADYPTFNWATIGATVIDSDRDGATTVEWKNRQFTRRRGNPDYEPVVYFSRGVGKDKETGKNLYEWLITFREPPKAKRLPDDTKDAMEQAATKRQTQPTPPVRIVERAPSNGATTVQQPPAATTPPQRDGVACSLRSWDTLQKAVDSAARYGVTPEVWKPRVEKIVGTTDMRSLDDADIAKATQAIKMMTAEAASRAPVSA